MDINPRHASIIDYFRSFTIMKFRTLEIILIILLCSVIARAQVDKAYVVFIDDVSEPQQVTYFSDSLAAAKYTSTFMNEAILEGYVPEVAIADSIWTVTKGPKYELGELEIASEDLPLISASGLRSYNWGNRGLSPKSLQFLPDKIITYLENNGYPYAEVRLDDAVIQDEKLHARLVVDKGELMVWDSLAIRGNGGLRKNILARHLDIISGQPYSLKRFLEVKKKVDELHYLKLTRDPEVSFYNNQAQVKLHIDAQPSSRFDFLIGILPSEGEGGRKFKIIGELNGELHNKLGLGERFKAEIKRLTLENQQVGLLASFPYIFNMPIGTEGTFDLFKRGQEFIESKGQIGLTYRVKSNHHLNTYVHLKSSRLIDIDEEGLLATNRLPRQLDVSYRGVGISYKGSQVDYIYNPVKGWIFDISSIIGQKRIIRNRTIEALSEEFSKSYDTLMLKSVQLESHALVAYHHPIKGIGTIRTSLESGWIFNNADVYQNEYWRLGGNKKLRGFDELSISTDAYFLGTLDLRIITGRNSFISLPFVDYGMIHDPVDDAWDTYLGIGLGINFATPAGLFNVSFALGKRPEVPWDFNTTKVHFGYVSLF